MCAFTKRGKLVKEKRRFEIKADDIQYALRVHKESFELAVKHDRGFKDINAAKLLVLKCKLDLLKILKKIESIKRELSPHLT